MSTLTPEEIARIEHYYAEIQHGDGGFLGSMRAALDPRGVALMCHVVRDVVDILGYRLVQSDGQPRHRLVPKEEGRNDDECRG